jgi:flavin reductase (DIM6/NTAB) family NADH-FMN oxidoreductase RutF/rubredoxin
MERKMNLTALYKLGYGVYVVCSQKDGKFNGQIANTVFQVSSDPPTVAVSINKNNLTHEYIEASKVFTASVLCQDTPMTFIGRFGFRSGREIDKFAGTNYRIGETGAPVVLDNAVSYFEAKVIGQIDVYTHTIFVGEVVNADVVSDKVSMTYEFYHQMKKGKTPSAAPTYIPPEKKEAVKVSKYQCKICGYIYDPAAGDPENGIKPGTAFESLPENWVCPVCGAAKSEFEKVS